MKKVFAVVLMVVLSLTVVSALFACNLDEEDGTTITFYTTMGQTLTPILDKYIEKFNQIYPDITVKYEAGSSYDDVKDKVSKEIQVGKGPNVAYCYPDHVALYNRSKKVVVLDDYINSTDVVPAGKFGNTEDMPIGLTTEQINDFVPAYYNEGKAFGDDKMYMLPFSKSTEVLYYNVEAFKAAGLVDADGNAQVPTHWWCSESCPENCTTSMEYVCKKLKEWDSYCIPLGYDSEANWFITMTEQLGTPYTSATGNHYLFNNDENKAFCTRFSNWYANGWVTTSGIYGSYTSGLFVNEPSSGPNAKDSKGNAIVKSYMSIGSSAGATHQAPTMTDGKAPFTVGISSIPQANASSPKVISNGPSVCILGNATEDQKLASWLFIKYFTTNVEFQVQFSMTSGYVPVIESVSDNATFKAHLASADGTKNGIAALSSQVCWDQKNAYFVSPAFSGSSKARSEAESLLQTCLGASKDADGNVVSADAIKAAIDAAFTRAVANCEYSYPSDK